MSERFQEQPDSFYVETSASEHIFHHLQSPGCNHLLLLGPAGMGKTTLLHHMGRRLSAQGHVVVSVELRTFRSVEELVAQLLDRLFLTLTDDSELLKRLRIAYATVSPAEAISAFATVLEIMSAVLGGEQRIFILLDGLDEREGADEELFGQRMLDWLAGVPSRNGCIVLASRPLAYIERSFHAGRTVKTFELGRWSDRELAHLIALRLQFGNLSLPQHLIDATITASEGVPLAAMLVLQHTAATGQLPGAETLENSQTITAALVYGLNAFELSWGDRNEFWSILLVCWAARRIAATEIARATGLPQARIDAWIAKAEAWSFIERQGNVVVLHDHFHHVIMQELLPAGVDLGALEFGDEAAERDQLLTTSFEAASDIPAILAGRMTIVLGDRGAGKSAIFRSLSEYSTGVRAANTIVAAEKNPADFLASMGTAAEPSAERFKAIWLLYIALLAARELQSLVETKTSKGRRYRDDCHRLLRSLGLADEILAPTLMSRLASPLRALLPEKLSFTVGPVQIEQEFNNSEKANSNAVDINDFLRRTESVLEQVQCRLVVVFDQIDEAHKYQQSQEQLVQGLLMAESKLAQTSAIRLVVLLRTDLYEIFHIEEKNKLRSRSMRLTWQPSQLAQQLLRRTYSNDQLKHVAERLGSMGIDQKSRELIQMRLLFPAMIERKEFWHWLMDQLATGNQRVAPRQIVLFMNLLKEEARTAGTATRIPLYSEQQVLAALKELSRLSFREVIDDFKVATVLVQHCMAMNLHRIKFADVEKLSDPGQGTPAAQVDQLRRLGFFEHAASQDDGQVVPELQVAALYRRFWT